MKLDSKFMPSSIILDIRQDVVQKIYLSAIFVYILYHLQAITPYSFALRLNYHTFMVAYLVVVSTILLLSNQAQVVISKLRSNWIYFAFILYLIVNTLLLSEPDKTINYYFQSLFLICSIFMIGVVSPQLPKYSYNLLGISACLTLIIFTIIFVSGLEVTANRLYRLQVGYRIIHDVFFRVNPNNIAAICMPILAGIIAWTMSENKASFKVLSLFGIAVGSWILGATYSIAAFAGCLALIILIQILYIFGKLQVRYRWVLIVTAAIILGLLVGILTCHIYSPDDFEKSYTKVYTGNVRLRIWTEFFQLAMQEPYFGHGFANKVSILTQNINGDLKRYWFGHGYPMHVFVQGGFLGLLLFIAVIFKLVIDAIKCSVSGYVLPILLVSSISVMFLIQKGPLLFHPAQYSALVILPLAVVLITRANLKDYN